MTQSLLGLQFHYKGEERSDPKYECNRVSTKIACELSNAVSHTVKNLKDCFKNRVTGIVKKDRDGNGRTIKKMKQALNRFRGSLHAWSKHNKFSGKNILFYALLY